MTTIVSNNNVELCLMKDYISTMEEYSIDNYDDLITLFKQYKQTKDKKIKDEIILGNMKLVLTVARRRQTAKFNIMDTIQEGMIGLICAVERFDVDKGIRFSSFAYNIIDQRIIDYMYKNTFIRLPWQVTRNISELNKIDNMLLRTENRKGCIEDYLAETTMRESIIQTAIEMRKISTESIEYCTSNEESENKLSYIESDNVDVVTELFNDMVKSFMDVRLKDILNDREMFVIDKRFGLSDGEPMALQAIGNELDRTREAIRQIELKAMKKIRAELKIGFKTMDEFLNEDITF